MLEHTEQMDQAILNSDPIVTCEPEAPEHWRRVMEAIPRSHGISRIELRNTFVALAI